MFSLHNHSIYSHDGHSTVFEMAQSAIKLNMKGFAVTDHIDLLLYEQRSIYDATKNCYNDVIKAKQTFGDKIKILMGAEIGEEIFNPQKAKEIRDIGEYDVFLASCHFIPTLSSEYNVAYADIPIWSNTKIKKMLDDYFDILLQTVKTTDFDVLAHLDYPIRYVNSIYKKNYDVTAHDGVIKEIFKIVIKKDKAIEVNTSNAVEHNAFLPNEYHVKMFKQLGGKYVTLGSDAHFCAKLCSGILEGKKLLKKCGFDDYYYFENHTPHPVSKL